jgi:hydroxylamine reductase
MEVIYMFCYQCEETLNNKGCTTNGVCGKKNDVANLQDLLIYTLKGISFWAVEARKIGIKDERADGLIIEGLFSTVTNVNFDAGRFVKYIEKSVSRRDTLREKFLQVYEKKFAKKFNDTTPDCAIWHPTKFEKEELLQKAEKVGIMSDKDLNEDVRSLREFLIVSLKGMAAYLDHAYALGFKDDSIYMFVEEALDATLKVKDVDGMLGYVMKAGTTGLKAMELLDRANTSHYGDPEPTMVNIGVKQGPAILISGHDLRDLEELLDQTKGTGVNVYTHGEMLPANAYPYFKRYDNLVGNYGNAWWMQNKEFEQFNGPIIMTTNCLTPPTESYKGRVFTTGLVGWPDVKHIPDRIGEEPKDFSSVIKMALEIGKSPVEIEKGTIPIGYARNAVLNSADTITKMVKNGKIKRFFVLSGCDGRFKSRDYYTNLALKLPKDTIILTSGCAKYRYNKLDLGNIDGLPRILDAGQCNDSYTWIATAAKLTEIFGVGSVNDLPISFDLAWYEQKAAFILNVLLSLGVKNIRLGPTLPAFVSPNVLKVLVDKFDIKPNGTVDRDLEMMMQGK